MKTLTILKTAVAALALSLVGQSCVVHRDRPRPPRHKKHHPHKKPKPPRKHRRHHGAVDLDKADRTYYAWADGALRQPADRQT